MNANRMQNPIAKLTRSGPLRKCWRQAASGDAAADGAQEEALARVAGGVVEPEDDVAETPFAIRDAQLDDRRRGAARVDQRVDLAHCAAQLSALRGRLDRAS